MIYHYTLIQMGKIKISDNTKCWQGRGESTHMFASVNVK